MFMAPSLSDVRRDARVGNRQGEAHHDEYDVDHVEHDPFSYPGTGKEPVKKAPVSLKL
jgi:hypothetical protein